VEPTVAIEKTWEDEPDAKRTVVLPHSEVFFAAPEVQPRTVGDYELLGEIARGGMGIVFRARQRSLNRLVALKMIRTGHGATETDVQRFRNEAEAVARLDDPHIVPIYEVGVHQGFSYYSMKLIEGGNLSKRLPEFTANPRAGARLLATIARAVHHAHLRGVLHRDLTPSNILLDAKGQPLLADFGLAKRIEGGSELTQTGAILGTPPYMAPEQASGRKGSVTVVTDVYGLGAILYTLLTGRPPFRGDSALETLGHVLAHEPVPPSTVRPGMPRDLETICLRCLEKDPARRYSSAGAVAEDIERWLAGTTILARPVSRGERAWRWCRRNPLAAALMGLICLLSTLAVAAFIAGTNVHQATQQLSLTLMRRQSVIRRHEYATDMKQAFHLVDDNRIEEVIDQLARQRPAPGDEDPRRFAWYYLWRLCHAGRLTLRGHREEVYYVAFSPDGKSLATCGKDRTIQLWDVDTGQRRLILRGHTDDINWVAFSPDGRSLASASDDNSIKLWDATKDGARMTLSGLSDRVLGVLFSPDGKCLISCGRDGGVIVWDPATGRQRSSFRVPNAKIESMTISPDGATLAASGRQVGIWDLAGRRELLRLDGHGDAVNSVAFSHEGKAVATACRDGVVRVWDARTGRVRATFLGHRAAVQSVAFSPDDRTLASVDDRGSVRFWDVSSGAVGAIATGQDRLWCVAFSPDGRTLATTSRDGTVKLWDPVRDRDRIAIQVPSPVVHATAFSADSKAFSVAGENGCVWTWDAAQGKLLEARRLDSCGAIDQAAISRDACLLATVDRERTIALWNLQSGHRTIAPRELGFCVAISPDGKWVAACERGEAVTMWDTLSGQKSRLPAVLVSRLAFSPDGQTLAISHWGGGSPELWSPAAGQSRVAGGAGHKNSITALAFSPDGQSLATGGNDKTIKFWDVNTLKIKFTLFGHGDEVTTLAFSPDGGTLASSAGERVKLWNIAAQEELAELEGHTGPVDHVVFSPDGSTLATSAKLPIGKCQVFLWRSACSEEVQRLSITDTVRPTAP
jgi:WD40 repeat protein